MKVFSHPAITDVKDMRTLYPIAFSVDSKSYLVLSMNSNGQVLEQVVHKRKSCRGDWPKFTLPQSAPQSLSDMWRFSFEIGAAKLGPVTKVAPKPPFLWKPTQYCVVFVPTQECEHDLI